MSERNLLRSVPIGERIKSARLRAGMSLRELALRVGVSAQALSKYERNEDVPSSRVLINLSKALDVSAEYLLRPATVTLSSPAYRRHRSKMTKQAENLLLAQVQKWLERYFTIERLVGKQLPFTPPDIPRKVNEIQELEEVAVALRNAWRLGLDALPNLTETLEEQGIKVSFLPAVDSCDALALVANGTVPVIVVRRDVPGDRQRFSIAHELAHLLLELPEDWSLTQVELAANRFAGAFLVPKQKVVEELGTKRHFISAFELYWLKHKYGLSMQGWVFRARDVGVISQATASRLFQWFRQNGWHRTEPGTPYPAEVSTRLERLVLHALKEDIIRAERAVELLGKSLKELEAVELLGKSMKELEKEVQHQHGELSGRN